MDYLVKVLHLDGVSRTQVLSADSREDLFDLPGIGTEIESVITPLPFGAGLLSPKLPLPQQLLLVAQIATLVDSGASIKEGIMELAEETDFLSRHLNDPRMKYASSISDYLEIFGTNSAVILLAKSGEETGRLSEALNNAVENIEQEMELKKATGSDLKMGVTYLIVGFLSILVLSLLLGGPAQQIIETPQLKANQATEIIVMIKNFQTEQTWLFLSLAVGLALAIRYLWKEVPDFRRVPGVSALDDLLKARRSANFLAAWMPLFASGLSAEQALRLIHDSYTGDDKKAVEAVLDGVADGGTIPSSLSKEYWSSSFVVGMRSFDSAHDEARSKLLGRLKKMLLTEIHVTGKKFSGITLKVGMIAAVTTVMLIALGFYAPMLLSRG